MDRCRILLVDAFTDTPLSGNVAGIVPNGDAVTDDQMAAIARELSVSETAFLIDSDRADRGIRYFTPTTEIELCGHATVASHAHLFADGVIDAGTHTLETPVGVIDVEVTQSGVVWMTQDSPTVREVEFDVARLASALDVPEAAIAEMELPGAVASTGLPFLIVPLTFLEPLGGAEPDFAMLESIASDYDAAGVYAFSFDTIAGDSTLHGRCFLPGAGIDEDPVTGTASGAVGAYLRTVDAFDSLPEGMRFEQGHFMNRPGHVLVRAQDEIRVGGEATTVLDADLQVPPAAADDIITT